MYSENTIKLASKVFGAFFIMAFVSYGFGSGMLDSVAGISIGLESTYGNRNLMILGVIAMAIIHTLVNIGVPVIMTPILKHSNKMLTYGYLSAGITATITLIIGAVLMMMLVPLSSEYLANPDQHQYLETLALLLKKGNFYAYQIGMALWGIGGLFFCHLLLKSRLVPKGLVIWGTLGYIVFISGTILELFDLGYGVQLALPGGLFELSLSVWLIIKGLNYSRYESLVKNRA